VACRPLPASWSAKKIFQSIKNRQKIKSKLEIKLYARWESGACFKKKEKSPGQTKTKKLTGKIRKQKKEKLIKLFQRRRRKRMT